MAHFPGSLRLEEGLFEHGTLGHMGVQAQMCLNVQNVAIAYAPSESLLITQSGHLQS